MDGPDSTVSAPMSPTKRLMLDRFCTDGAVREVIRTPYWTISALMSPVKLSVLDHIRVDAVVREAVGARTHPRRWHGLAWPYSVAQLACTALLS